MTCLDLQFEIYFLRKRTYIFFQLHIIYVRTQYLKKILFFVIRIYNYTAASYRILRGNKWSDKYWLNKKKKKKEYIFLVFDIFEISKYGDTPVQRHPKAQVA